MRISWLTAAATAALAVSPTSATAACKVARMAELAVTMEGRQPIVTTPINGRDARFILDSGAFFSTIAAANAREYGLTVEAIPNAQLRGIGGSTSLGVATAKQFTIAGQSIPRVQFAVGGSDTGYAGLFGQNILGLADVEYDLAHGAVRMMKADGCKDVGMAYWAGAKPFTIVKLLPMGADQRHTIGTITVNGVPMKAVFDTGAHQSLLTLAAAKRLGVTPTSPGVVASGFAYGLGTGRSRAWRARFASIDFGGEAIPKPWIDIADQSFDDADMLVGIDFFLTHRLYVDNRNHRMFITYEGGSLFGLSPQRAVDRATGAALDLADKAGDPADADGYSRRGAVLASAGKLDAALVDFDKAVALAPTVPRFLTQRAAARLANRQPKLAALDLDRAIELAPADPDPRLTRARLRLGTRDPAGARADLEAADRLLAPSSDRRIELAGLYDTADAPELGLASYDQWLKAHPEDSGRASALNGRCWARALLGRELDRALGDCDAALKMRPGDVAYLDSRALVRFRRGELDRAMADYDAALAGPERSAWSLYARGLVERRLGRNGAADADRAAALALDPAIGARAKRYGLEH